jgi:hypothetical protein
MKKLLGLTLHRPWPILIAKGLKSIENRTWSPEPRLQPGEWFAIHAGKKYDDRCSPMAQRLGVDMGVFFDKQLGVESAIVCLAKYGGVVTESENPWFFGPKGWLIERVVPIEPIPCKGHQQLWEVPAPLADRCRAAYIAATTRHAVEDTGDCAPWCIACNANVVAGLNPDGSPRA